MLVADERRRLAEVWGLDGPPRFDAGHLPLLGRTPAEAAAGLGLSPEAAEALLDSARAKLLVARATRSLPRDDKVLAGWNGLALSAQAAGAQAFDDPGYREAAGRLSAFLAGRLMRGDRVYRAVDDQGWTVAATLDDYAYLAQGLWDWAQNAGSEADRTLSLRLVDLAWLRFHGEDGWRLDADSLRPGIPAEVALRDSPLPSPVAVLIGLVLAGATLRTPDVRAAPSPAASRQWPLIPLGSPARPCRSSSMALTADFSPATGTQRLLTHSA